MVNRVEGKVALVSGAGSIGPGWGNGKAAAVLYAREGAQVFAIDINLDAAEETREIIEREGGRCVAHQADVSSSDDVQSAVDACISELGRVDILHNNVGIADPGGLEDVTEEVWDRTFEVNVKSMYLTCRACLPHMVRQRSGAIVNISAIAAVRQVGYPCVAYGAGKAAVNHLTQSIAIEYANRGIRANVILPGLMHTPLVEQNVLTKFGGDFEKMIESRKKIIPMKRYGDAWDVAYAALYLASDEAKYVTGTELVVDGGVTCKVCE